jgi:hypothetical protein
MNEDSQSLGWDPTGIAGEPSYRIIRIGEFRIVILIGSLSHSLSLSLTFPLSLTHSPSLHFLIHSLCLSLSLSLSSSLSLSLSLSFSFRRVPYLSTKAQAPSLITCEH